jgi:acyl carrier protein
VVRPDFTELAQAGDPRQLGDAIENWMLVWLAEQAHLERAELKASTPFAELGVDSMTAIELNQELEETLRLKIPPVAAWDYPTPATLARYLAEQFLERV